MKKINILLLIILYVTFFNKSIAQTVSKDVIALTNVTIIDVENSQQIENMTIIIENDNIKSIQPSDSTDLQNVGETVNLKGKYVIPGLIDSHVHLFRPKNRKEILNKLLYSGVTSVRDMGGDARMYKSLSKEIISGNLEGPDIFYSATFFGPTFLKDPRTKFAAMGYEPGTAPWMRLITVETDLEKVIAEAKEFGVSGIKVYSNVEPELLEKLSKAANNNGLKMWSHSSIFPSRPSDAVKANVNVLSHSVGMIFELEKNMPISFNEAIRKSVPLQDFENTDASAPEFITLFKAMQSNATVFEPTLSSWNKTVSSKQKNAKPVKANQTNHLSNAANKLDVDAMNDWAKRITNAAYTNGVTISAGTDFITSIKWVQDEIKFLTECGLTNIDAIKAATINNAKVIGIENTHGSVSIGKKANLVILSENPLENIENIRKVFKVYKNGKEYLRK